jgi:hypothetical protein
MALLRIDRGDLLMALSSHHLEHYLDLQTGVVIRRFEDLDLDDEEDRAALEKDLERYRSIEPIPSPEGFRWMESFALQQADQQAREDLLSALERRRPFRSFKDALLSYPELRAGWFAFEEERVLEYAREWLSGEGIQAELVAVPPPEASA